MFFIRHLLTLGCTFLNIFEARFPNGRIHAQLPQFLLLGFGIVCELLIDVLQTLGAASIFSAAFFECEHGVTELGTLLGQLGHLIVARPNVCTHARGAIFCLYHGLFALLRDRLQQNVAVFTFLV